MSKRDVDRVADVLQRLIDADQILIAADLVSEARGVPGRFA
jgi:hypothetical protein